MGKCLDGFWPDGLTKLERIVRLPLSLAYLLAMPFAALTEHKRFVRALETANQTQ